MDSYHKSEIKLILEENKRLKMENEGLRRRLDSRRYRFAEKIANTCNIIFPLNSPQRKLLRSIYSPIKNRQEKRSRKIIQSKVESYDRIIVMCTIPWKDKLRQRPHHLSKCLAQYKNYLIIYFEPGEPKKKYRKLYNNFVTTNSWETILRLNLDNKKAHFFFNNVSNIEPDLIKKVIDRKYQVVYEYIDEFHEDISGPMKNQIEIYESLPKYKPIVLTSATKLFDDAKKHFSKSKIIVSKNAVIVEDFNYHNYENIKPPKDLKRIIKENKPIVGYYGALAPWLDYDLISETIDRNKDYNFVFIGVNYQNALEKLNQKMPNIYYLGPKKYSELPRYSRFFDCAIIPFKNGEIAKGTSPVKMFEYMAMGLPIIGTKDLIECKGYNHVFLAKDKNDFSKLIKKAIEEHKKTSVRESLLFQAKNNTWEARARDIIKGIE